MTTTLADRKAFALIVLQAKLKAIQTDLAAFARDAGGTFVLFGSVARGDIRPGSDFDVVIDFPPTTRQAAVELVERACETAGVPHDIYLISDVPPLLAKRVARDGVAL